MIVEGRLVLDEAVEPGRIVIEDGVIASVVLDPDVVGPYIVPGFVDVHVHGWGGHDAMGDLAALDGMARALLRHGVTSFLPTAVSAPLPVLAEFAARVRAWMPAAPADGAAPLGFDLEGPFLADAKRGAHDPGMLRDPAGVDAAEIEPLLDGLRLITIAPERPGALALIARLRAVGVRVALGHSAATLLEARAGYDAGATSTTHLFNGMSGVDHRAPGLAAAALVDDRAYVELIADGEHVDPAIWPIVTRTKPAEPAAAGQRRHPAGWHRRRPGTARRAGDRGHRPARHARRDLDARRFGHRARHRGAQPGRLGGGPAGCRRGRLAQPRRDAGHGRPGAAGARPARRPRRARRRPPGPPGPARRIVGRRRLSLLAAGIVGSLEQDTGLAPATRRARWR